MKSQKYWSKRAVENEKAWNNRCKKTVEKELAAHYQRALREIKGDILKLYATFAKDNGLDFGEAQRLLSSKEFREWRMSMQEYLQLISGDDKGLERELNTLAVRPRITRLEKLYAETLQELDKLGRNVDTSMKDFLAESYKSNYAKDIFDLVKVGGLSVAISKLDNIGVEKVLASRWSGKNFSQRVWTNTKLLGGVLKETVANGIHRGLSIQQMSRMVENKMNSGYKNAVRLVRTEMNFANNQAHFDSMKDAGVDAYEFIAVLDNRTSTKCKTRDGETYLLEEKSVGFNYPPLHPRCRSTVAPFIEGVSKKGTRIAKDKSGKYIDIPSSMTYKDYEKVYLKKESTLDEWKQVSTSATIKPVKNGVKSTNSLPNPSKYNIINKTTSIQNFEELKTYWLSKYKIKLDDSLEALDFQAVHEATSGIEAVIKEFPKARKYLIGIDAESLASPEINLPNAYMCAIWEGYINIDKKFFSSYESLVKDIAEDVKFGHHPRNSTLFGAAAHEMGHILERAIIKKHKGGIDDWEDMTYSEKIVKEAVAVVQSIPEGKLTTKDYKGNVSVRKIPAKQLKRRISAYADDKGSECLAEAVCDVITNGENAYILSKEIWKILKRELG